MTGGLFIYATMQSLGAFRYQFRNCQLNRSFGRFEKGKVIPLIKIFYDDGIIELYPEFGKPMTYRFEIRVTERITNAIEA